MKKIAIVLLAVILVVCSVALIACDNGSKALDLYIFDKEGQVVKGEFELPRKIGEYDATWTSDSDLITITDRSAEAKDYLATVTRAESEITTVNLTVKVKSSTKTFSVLVTPIDVYDFSEAYSFPKDRASVTETFDLDAKTKIGDKEATITWAVDAEYADYIKVENGKCVVTPSSLDPQVRIKATFSYNGETTTKQYRMTVSIQKTHLESIDYWYNNTGVSVEIKGYVVSVATAYSAQYNNITLYVVDEDGCCGYYVYRVVCDNKDDGAKIKRGSYVEITNTTNTNYNGLIETNAGGNLKLDESKSKTEAQMKELCYAFDNDVLGKVPEAIYHTSQYVSLTNWKVSKVSEDVKSVDNADLFVIEKNGVKIAVRTSKYLEDAYKDKTDKTFTDIVALQKSLKAGDVITIKGILGNYKGYTLLPIDAADVVKVGITEDTPATINAMPGVKVGKFITAKDTGFNAVVEKNNLDLIITKAKDVALPASSTDVTVKYTILGTSDAITLDGNILKIAAPTKHERVHLQADFTCGDYTTTVFQYIHVWNKTDAEMVEDEKLQLYIDESVKLLTPSITPLPKIGTIYGANVTIKWAVKDAADHSYATIDKDGNLVISQMALADQSVTIVATLKSGEATDTKEFTLAIPNILIKVEEPVKDTAYSLVISQANRNETLFVMSSMSGFYVATSTNIEDGAKYYMDKVENGVQIYYKNGDKKVYLSAEPAWNNASNKATTNIVLSETTKTVWEIDEAGFYKTTVKKYKDQALTQEDGTSTVFIGTNGNYNTVSLADVAEKKITADKIGTEYFPIYFATVSEIKDIKDGDAARAAVGTLSLSSSTVLVPQSITLPSVKNFSGAATSWALEAPVAGVEIKDGKLVVSSLPSADTIVKLVATVTVGKESVSRTFEVKVLAKKVDKVTDPAADTAYKLVIDQLGSGKQLFAVNAMQGYYVKAESNVANGHDVYLEASGTGYKIYFKAADGKKTYIGAEQSGTYNNIKLQETTETVWTIDEKGQIGTTLGDKTVYICTWGSNDDIRISDRATYAAYLATPVTK